MYKLASSDRYNLENPGSRIESIDVLRGLVIVLMTLDHCRDFFHIYAFDYNPEDLNFTTPLVFYTRIITHLCAPAFVLLAGISAFLYGNKPGREKKDLAKYLLVRGAILIFLEITFVRFAWRFYIDYSSIGGLVIWAIGWSMIFLAGIIYLPRWAILALGLTIIVGHNLLDGIKADQYVFTDLVWSFFHESKYVPVTETFGVNILYPVLPMIGLIAVGYYIGVWFTSEYKSDIRTGYLLYVGLGLISLFVCLRFSQYVTQQYSYIFYPEINDGQWEGYFKKIILYVFEKFGDPNPWVIQENVSYTTMAFFSTTKYPMSLMYILMTIGPSLILLSWFESSKNIFTKIMLVYGKVPMFYYLVHLFIIHALAILFAVLSHLDKMNEIISGNWKLLSENYGYKMPVVYLIWLFVLLIHYPLCIWYGKLKSRNKSRLLSYL